MTLFFDVLGLLAVVWTVALGRLVLDTYRRQHAAPAAHVDRLLRAKVIVTLKSGETFGGVLWEHDESTMVLRGAYLIGGAEKGENLPVDGELMLYTVDVAYWQKP